MAMTGLIVSPSFNVSKQTRENITLQQINTGVLASSPNNSSIYLQISSKSTKEAESASIAIHI